MTEETQDMIETVEIGENDILFNCPHCDKSLTINQAGAGMMIACPDCSEQVQVPGLDNDQELGDQNERVRQLADALAQSQARVQELVENLAATQRRRGYLEHLRVKNMERFEALSREMFSIQSSLDRSVSLLEESEGNAPPVTGE